MLQLFHAIYDSDPHDMLDSAGDTFALQGRTRFSFRDYYSKRIAWTTRKSQIAWYRRAAGISSRHWDPPPRPPQVPPQASARAHGGPPSQDPATATPARPTRRVSPPRDVDGVVFGSGRRLRSEDRHARNGAGGAVDAQRPQGRAQLGGPRSQRTLRSGAAANLAPTTPTPSSTTRRTHPTRTTSHFLRTPRRRNLTSSLAGQPPRTDTPRRSTRGHNRNGG